MRLLGFEESRTINAKRVLLGSRSEPSNSVERMRELFLPLLKLRQASLPKILRVSLLLAATIFITLLAQSKPPTTYAVQCASRECEPDKYVCGSTFGADDMCCTGGGCPSWVCVQLQCQPIAGDLGWGCYEYKCEPGYDCHCEDVPVTCCKSIDKNRETACCGVLVGKKNAILVKIAGILGAIKPTKAAELATGALARMVMEEDATGVPNPTFLPAPACRRR
jgi:hypothetical protein